MTYYDDPYKTEKPSLFDLIGNDMAINNAKNVSQEMWDSMNDLQKASILTTPVPLLPDVLGLAGDAQMYMQEPETRSPVNYGLSLAGALPFIPMAGILAGKKTGHSRARIRADEHLGSPNSTYWNKAEKDRIAKEGGYGDGYANFYTPVAKANLKGTVRAAQKNGWNIGHTSKQDGAVSSYYLKKDGVQIRLSDHELPDTPQRTHNYNTFGSASWDEELIVDNKSDIAGVLTEIEGLYDYYK